MINLKYYGSQCNWLYRTIQALHRTYGLIKTTTSSATILTLELRLFLFVYLFIYSMTRLGRDSSVGIATRYGLDGQGIESR